MKTYLRTLFLSSFLFSLIFSCNQASKPQTVLAKNKVEVQMKIDGMVCAMGCAKYIEDEVGKIQGVVAGKVNFENETASFEFDQAVLSAKEIETYINQIHDGQYQAEIITKSKPIEGNHSNPETSSNEEVSKINSKTKSLQEVRKKINFSFPELFTYFLNQL